MKKEIDLKKLPLKKKIIVLNKRLRDEYLTEFSAILDDHNSGNEKLCNYDFMKVQAIRYDLSNISWDLVNFVKVLNAREKNRKGNNEE